MKKFFPAVLLAFLFTAMMVSQMLINGEELSASKMSKVEEKHGLFESEFSKLEIKTTKGTKIKLSERSEPIVIVNFWASWCQPCVREFKSLNQLLEKYQDKVYVIGINNDTERPLKAIKKIENEYGLKFESMSDVDSEIASKFNVNRIPSSFVFYKGKVLTFAEKEFNFMDEDFLKKLDKKL